MIQSEVQEERRRISAPLREAVRDEDIDRGGDVRAHHNKGDFVPDVAFQRPLPAGPVDLAQPLGKELLLGLLEILRSQCRFPALQFQLELPSERQC